MSPQKVKKELLTNEKIKIDLLKLLKRDEKAAIVVLVASAVVLVVVALAFIVEQQAGRLIIDLENRIDYILYSILFIVASVCEIITLHKVVSRRKMLKQAAFDVDEDVLLGSTLDARVSSSPYCNCHLLQFSRSGDFYIPYGTSYEWSKDYYMSDRGVFNSAIVDDTFYVVTYKKDKKQQPVMVYNTKFFEYREEQ